MYHPLENNFVRFIKAQLERIKHKDRKEEDLWEKSQGFKSVLEEFCPTYSFADMLGGFYELILNKLDPLVEEGDIAADRLMNALHFAVLDTVDLEERGKL